MSTYHLIVKQQALFFPVRAPFIQHMSKSLQKFGLAPTSTPESRIPSIEASTSTFKCIPLSLRETMASYLTRIATFSHKPAMKANLMP